jgi:DNA-binding NtrC family response regulator
VANNGTLFLDEVSNISLEIQSKLLRVLETFKLRRVGDTTERNINIRLISASNRDLARNVKENTFREDLFYRLQVIPIHLPLLRERKGDIINLATVFLNRIRLKNRILAKSFSAEAVHVLENYHWPGNIRELKNTVERIAILCDSEIIEPGHLPGELKGQAKEHIRYDFPETWKEFKEYKQLAQNEAVMQMEKQFLSEALNRAGGNISKAAKTVGIQRSYFHSLLRKYNLDVKKNVSREP